MLKKTNAPHVNKKTPGIVTARSAVPARSAERTRLVHPVLDRNQILDRNSLLDGETLENMTVGHCLVLSLKGCSLTQEGLGKILNFTICLLFWPGQGQENTQKIKIN